MESERIKIDINQIPKADLDSLCRATIAACEKFYSDPKNVEHFEKWKAERDKKSKEVQDDGTIFKEDET